MFPTALSTAVLAEAAPDVAAAAAGTDAAAEAAGTGLEGQEVIPLKQRDFVLLVLLLVATFYLFASFIYGLVLRIRLHRQQQPKKLPGRKAPQRPKRT